MKQSPYPYATLEKHGFQLAVVESDDTSRSLAAPLARDEDRFAVQPGDTVKLIFEYRETMKATGSGEEIGAEHMWVTVTDFGDGCLLGRLDNAPQYTRLLKLDDVVAFHPKHVIAIWKADEEKRGEPGATDNPDSPRL